MARVTVFCLFPLYRHKRRIYSLSHAPAALLSGSRLYDWACRRHSSSGSVELYPEAGFREQRRGEKGAPEEHLDGVFPCLPDSSALHSALPTMRADEGRKHGRRGPGSLRSPGPEGSFIGFFKGCTRVFSCFHKRSCKAFVEVGLLEMLSCPR